ncbi:hypothetical protein [Patulibacter minatonensis]|uniref:hypothetical protein n=1 Tax=Patulibacter minatonensis TaxID=298163 RepID=UPI000479B826|nr:hypothetical protein [Patulibacter minatonensis]
MSDLHDVPFLVAFGEELDRIATATPPPVAPGRRRWRLPMLVLPVAMLAVGGTSAAGTLLVLDGSPIPGFARSDDAAQIRPTLGTARIAALRAPDPDRTAAPWTLRLSTSGDLSCVAVGQVEGDRFGLVGLDGRFRGLPVRGGDSCATAPRPGAPIAGARTLAGSDRDEVRTVLYADGGADLTAARVRLPGGEKRDVPVSDGATVAVLRGYPEDARPTLELEWRDGKRFRQTYGASDLVIPDPYGGPAWKTEAGVFDRGVGRTMPFCFRVLPAREPVPYWGGPAICAGGKRRVLFDVLTLRPGQGGPARGFATRWRWRGPARTFIAGANLPVRSLTLTLPDGTRRPLGTNRVGRILEVLPATPTGDVSRVRIDAVLKDGTTTTYRPGQGVTRRSGGLR